MSPLFAMLAQADHRPLKSFVLVLGALIALWGLLVGVQRIWAHLAHRRGRRLQFEAWAAIARARGFVVERGGEPWAARARDRGFELRGSGNEPVMRGMVADRPFELDSFNFFGYGVDAENAFRFRVEDLDASLSIRGDDGGHGFGELQPGIGDEEFDKHFRVRANPSGLRGLTRMGPKERRLLVDHHREFIVDQHRGEVRIRLPYRIEPAHLDAALLLAEGVWGSPPSATREA